MKKIDLTIVMPVYNEEEIITKVLEDWLKITDKIKSIIIVIDDGSKDNTLKILKKFKSQRIKVLSQNNSGHGPAILNGYKKAIQLKSNYIFQVDTDNQFYTSDFKKFWNLKKNYDFIIGFRKIRYDDKLRLLIKKLLRIFLFIIFNVKIKDSNIPYRLMKKNFLLYALKNFNLKTNIPNIFLSIIASKKFKNHTITVKHKKRMTGKVWIVNLKLLKFCIISFINLLMLRFKI